MLNGISIFFAKRLASIVSILIVCITLAACGSVEKRPSVGNKNISATNITANNIIQPKPGFSGNWVTRHRCGRKEVFGLLTIGKFNSPNSKSQWTLMQDNTSSVLELNQTLTNKNNQLSLKAGKWLFQPQVSAYPQPSKIQPVDLTLNLDSTGFGLEGNVSNGNHCGAFSAHKYVRYSNDAIKKGVINLDEDNGGLLSIIVNRGQRTGKKVSDQQCIKLLNWQSRNKTQMITRNWSFDSNVTNDILMLEMFGKTYDNWTMDNAESYGQIFANCRSQLASMANTEISSLVRRQTSRVPLQQLGKGYGLARYAKKRTMGSILGLGEDNRYEKESYGWSKHFYSVAASRAAKVYFKSSIKAIQNLPHTKESKISLTKKKQELSQANSILKFLSPEDQQVYKRILQDKISETEIALLNQKLENFSFSNYARSNSIDAAKLERERFLKTAKKNRNSRLVSKINEKYNREIAVVLQEIVSDELSTANRILHSNKKTKSKLIELVKFRSTIGKKYQSILNEQKIKELLATLQKQRMNLLLQIEPQVTSSITSVRSIAKLNNPLYNLFTYEDHNLKVVQRLKKVLSDKQKALTAFKPVKNSSQLKVNSFTTEGLNYEVELMAVYLGDFDNARMQHEGITISSMFRKYLEAYGKNCSAYLPSNRVPITESKCVTKSITEDGWGNVEDTTCIEWAEVPTGLYADPRLYQLSNQVSKQAGWSWLKTIPAGNPLAGRSIVDDMLSIGSDMSRLVRMNKCSNAGLNRFEENFYRFVKREPPLLLPGKETIAMLRSIYQSNFDPESLDLRKLFNDLISENSKGWMMNRYASNSVSNVNVMSKNSDGSPRMIKASYRFNSFGKGYRGSVSLVFSNGLPKCLYFSDAPETCRHPSRGIINKYQKGKYLR